MKTARLFCRVLVVVTVASVFVLPVVSAQRLNGLWFKLKLSVKGHTLDDDTESVVSKLNFSAPVYAQFVTTAPQRYRINFWTQVDGVWTNLTSVNETLIGTNENFISDSSLTIEGSGGNSIHTRHTVYITSKLAGGTGEVVSATYDGVGEVNTGTTIDLGVTNTLYGGCTLKGKTIDPLKLPFVVP